MGRIGWLFYQAALAGGMALAAPYLLARRGRHYLETLPGRLGVGNAPAGHPGALWIHAVSVGEVGVAATLARALPAELPLVVTTVTPTGQARARETFAKGPFADRRVAVAYLPFDLGPPVARFLRRFDPAALVLVEGDYWPLTLHRAARRGVPIAAVNARVGERAARQLAWRPSVSRRLFFEPVAVFGVQSEEDRRRLIAGGVPPERIRLTGNLKYDTPPPAPEPELEERIRELAGGRPVLVAGSTMDGEDEQLLDAFRRLGGGERALLVVAPRHPERWGAVAEVVAGAGFRLRRRSELETETTGGDRPDVLLLDTLGELAALYGTARAAFVGGTLVPTGGHNPLEPAHFAVPTAVGPSMFNFRDMAARFEEAGAWRQVADAEELAAAWDGWLRNPAAGREVGERAAALLAANRGAVERTVELLRPLLEPMVEKAAERP